MDTIKIGKFIARTRKQHNMTQRQIADLLFISDKTVSKWECGKGLPDVSLMIPLCGILQITVNDLFAGEKVSENDYSEKVEDNIIALVEENDKIIKELRFRGWLTVILGAFVLMGVIYASKVLADNGLYGIPQIATAGMSGFIGIIIANGVISIIKGKKRLR